MVAGGYQYCAEQAVEVLMEGQWVSCAPLYSNPEMVVFTMVTSTSVVIIGAPWFTASWSHW